MRSGSRASGSKAAAAIRVGHHGLIAPDDDLFAGAERGDLAEIGSEKLLGRRRRLPATDAERRIDGAVAHKPDLDIGADRAEFREDAGRAAESAGAFAVRYDAPRCDADRMMQFVDLDAVVERHPGIFHGEQRQPAVIAERPRPAAGGEDHFVDEKCVAVPWIATRQHAGSRRNAGPRLPPCRCRRRFQRARAELRW